MKFKKWLEIFEATSLSGKIRAAGQDVSNIALGKLGPYGTFGQADQDPVKSTIKTGIAGVLGGFGQSLRSELGPIEIQPQLLDPVSMGSSFLKNKTLPLQLPFINNEQVIKFSMWSEKQAVLKIGESLQGDNDKRIRTIANGEIDLSPNKFDLYTDDQKDNDLSLFETAKAFTIALCKIKIYAELMKDKNFTQLENKYDLTSPTVIKQEVRQINQNNNDYYLIGCVFEYKINKKGTQEE